MDNIAGSDNIPIYNNFADFGILWQNQALKQSNIVLQKNFFDA